MMHFAYVFILTLLLPFMAQANDDNFTTAPFTDNKNTRHTQLNPKPLSLKDIEDLTDQDSKNINTQTSIKKTSTLEILYSERIIDQLDQYGYDLFDTNDTLDHSIPAGTVQNDYTLSAGDTLRVILRGQVNLRQDITVNNQGQLIVEDLPPILASGKTINTVQDSLREEIKSLHNTEIYVSLSSIRQIGVLVVGNVNKPGRKNMTGFHTALDAIIAAGGVQKDGSLRQIKLVRKGRITLIDLYQLMMSNGGKADTLLQDGDRLIIPPIGPTLAVTGSVKRAGIYEIRQGEKISLHQALNLAGGLLTPGQNRFIKLENTSNGEETVQNITNQQDRIFGDGAILNVAQSEQKKSREVQLSGHTRQPGAHDFNKKRTLSALINDEKILGKDIYPLIGVIERRDAKQLTKKLIAFSPYQVLHEQFDQPLQDGDEVHLFSTRQIYGLEQDDTLLRKASATTTTQDNDGLIDDPVLAAFLKERSIFVRGAVRQVGSYPATENTTLENILAVAGGLSLEANKQSIEVSNRTSGRKTLNLETTNPLDITLAPGDTVRANQKFHKIADQSVMIIGEVKHPGRYDLMAGDTMSKLVARAGGLLDNAYPDGAIFSRASERTREERRYKAQAQDLSLKLAASLQQRDDDKRPNADQIQTMESLITRLKSAQAVGRITIEADPASLKVDPEQDILLESGDRIFIPKRPLTVRVAGEVLSPAALQFRRGKEPKNYIREAGGTTYYADKDRTFVVYPDGSAQPLNVSMWNHTPNFIPPGSTIIVPRDPKPFDFIESAERISQVLANLAISGLYIEAIGDDN